MLTWPDAATVDRAVRRWADQMAAMRPEVRRVGYCGSYARGDWGVGSDVDLILVVTHAAEPFERRSVRWDTTMLPVPADLLVYTEAEWERLGQEAPFIRRIADDAVWVH